MSERERLSVFKIVRNSASAVALAVGPSMASHVPNVHASFLEQLNNRPTVTRQLSPDAEKTKFFEQLDEFVETKHGKALASAVLLFSIAQGLYTIQQSAERDRKRKFVEAAAASGLFFSLSAVIFAQSYTDIDPRVPASLLMAYSIPQALYNTENSIERDRPFRKRATNAIAAGSLLAASSTLLAQSIK